MEKVNAPLLKVNAPLQKVNAPLLKVNAPLPPLILEGELICSGDEGFQRFFLALQMLIFGAIGLQIYLGVASRKILQI